MVLFISETTPASMAPITNPRKIAPPDNRQHTVQSQNQLVFGISAIKGKAEEGGRGKSKFMASTTPLYRDQLRVDVCETKKSPYEKSTHL